METTIYRRHPIAIPKYKKRVSYLRTTNSSLSYSFVILYEYHTVSIIMLYLYPAIHRITRRHLLGDHPTVCRHNMDPSSRHLVFEVIAREVLVLNHPGVAALYMDSIRFPHLLISLYRRYLWYIQLSFSKNHRFYRPYSLAINRCAFPGLLSTYMTRLTEWDNLYVVLGS